MVRENRKLAIPFTMPPARPATNWAAEPTLLVTLAMTSASEGSPGIRSRSHCHPW